MKILHHLRPHPGGLVDDDLHEEEVIKATEKKNLENDTENETLEIDYSWLRFAPAFWSDEVHYDLVLRFSVAFWLCILLIEDNVAFCLENGVNILKSIDEGPYRMRTVREILAESTEGAPQFGPERTRIYSDLTSEEKDRGLRDSNYDQMYTYLKQHETHAKENKMMLERFSQPTVDPLALLSNVSNPHHYSPSSSASSSTQVPQPLADSSSPAKDLIKNLTDIY
nr:hypothetical protein [Tanacetum cinerariifolium]